MKKIFLVFLVLSVLALAACAGSSTNTESSTVPDSIPKEFAGKTSPFGAEAAVDGAIVFKNNCEPCHGPQGHGDGPAGAALDPKPKNLAELQVNVRDDYLFWRISAGKDGTAMVAWKGILTDEQIWQVIAFIRTLK